MMQGLQKVRGLRRLRELRLPMVESKIFEPDSYWWVDAFLYAGQLLRRDGYVSVRTDTEEPRAGSTPFLFMESDADRLLKFVHDNQRYWLIPCESIPPRQVLVQAHVELYDWFGYWKLRGEANDQDTRSCRHAIQQGTRETGLRDIWELEQYRPYWASIRRLLLDAGLFDRMAELTICKDGRIVFWEV